MTKNKRISLYALCFTLAAFSFMLSANTFSQFEIPWSPTIYNQDPYQALNPEWINNPIRNWAYKVINAGDKPENKVVGITSVDTEIQTHQTAENQVMQIIKNIINYALGLLSLVALVYLIYHGVLMLTAAGDDTQYKNWLKWIKYAAIALAGIGLSRIFVSFIFYILQTIMK